MAGQDTHVVAWDQPGRNRVRALCGVWILRREQSYLPTCPDCRRLLVELDVMVFE
jgi:hypothetical protein